jgi:16S rRNA (cytosine1402-N4)-methyltransferase
MKYHTSVLLQETISALNIKNEEKYIDATLGGGGHSGEIVKHGGLVLGIDADWEAIKFVEENSKSEIRNSKLTIVKGNFRDIDKIAEEKGFENSAGIIFDLGVSSNQIDNSERGFSYLKSGPLDMRMDQELGVKAADLVNALGRRELYDLFRTLGDEHHAHDISERIIARRKLELFETTDDLVTVLAESYGFSNISDFARATSGKKVFQALRIAVNDELGSLRQALPKALKLLKRQGRLVVISFHSLEDGIVKKEFRRFENEEQGVVITKSPIEAGKVEVLNNSRSKSAKLRIFEKK